MTQTPANPDAPNTDSDWHDSPPPKDSILLPILFVVLALGILGGIPWMLGLGPFGLRQILSEKVTLYVVNTTGYNLTIQLTNDPPRESLAQTVEAIETFSGQTTIQVINEQGEVLETHEWDLSQDSLLNALGSECMALVDLAGYYGEGASGQLEVVSRIRREDRLVHITADQLLLPRHTMPDQLAGTMHWLELVGCDLLNEDRADGLRQSLANRMAVRRQEAMEERARQQREQQQQQ
jgi:hypothetical protein